MSKSIQRQMSQSVSATGTPLLSPATLNSRASTTTSVASAGPVAREAPLLETLVTSPSATSDYAGDGKSTASSGHSDPSPATRRRGATRVKKLTADSRHQTWNVTLSKRAARQRLQTPTSADGTEAVGSPSIAVGSSSPRPHLDRLQVVSDIPGPLAESDVDGLADDGAGRAATSTASDVMVPTVAPTHSTKQAMVSAFDSESLPGVGAGTASNAGFARGRRERAAHIGAGGASVPEHYNANGRAGMHARTDHHAKAAVGPQMPQCHVVCELMDARTRSQVFNRTNAGSGVDFVLSTSLVARVLAMVAERREVNTILQELLGAHGASISLRDTAWLVSPSEGPVCFAEVARRARARAEIVIGVWSAASAMCEAQVALNPRDKGTPVQWNSHDAFVVLYNRPAAAPGAVV